MSFSQVIKKALQTLNRQYLEHSQYQKYLLTNAVRIVNHKHISTDNPNRYNFFERQSAFLFLITQSPNKFKLILNLASYNLQKHTNTLNWTFKWLKRVTFLIFSGLLSFGSYKSYLEYQKLQELMKEQNNIIYQQSTSWLGMIIRQQVYKNTMIQDNLQGLIVNLCEKPSIRHNTVKGLIRIYDIKDVKNNTPILIKQVLKTSVFYDDFIFQKLKMIIIQQLQNPQTRKLLQDLLVSFGSSDTCKDLVASNLANALGNKEVVDLVNRTAFSTLHEYLENPELRQYIANKIRSSVSSMNQSQQTQQ
ncbi:hypothetical protein TTHERM_00128979 (macronuclear) [Tetrahymena thermophila SB210]|uniref:Uncharacterized protein n=1 Tax=Tetrahymena thermophila (strain SB210) TaxID=312017 RepID=A4VDV7_TETTS|nr:hypothetical protein TTHERM_00128979 [Tetrahymena thermophila SB210]EDK31704.2 hypothetical protein TTHERM_00128979 [Tetrahymena thermophila SB210]|eukprot:XP_001470796.2 hypothetical protein TTHERM_00128979 [Tetrahymena thermophila SB210]